MSQAHPHNADCFAEFEAELAELLQFKWTESEREGRDIGFELALRQWTERYRHQWRKERRAGKI